MIWSTTGFTLEGSTTKPPIGPTEGGQEFTISHTTAVGLKLDFHGQVWLNTDSTLEEVRRQLMSGHIVSTCGIYDDRCAGRLVKTTHSSLSQQESHHRGRELTRNPPSSVRKKWQMIKSTTDLQAHSCYMVSCLLVKNLGYMLRNGVEVS